MNILEDPNSCAPNGELDRPPSNPGPLGELPTITRRQARLQERLGPAGARIGPGGLLGGIADLIGEGLTADRFEVYWRAAGTTRPGVVAQLSWPRLGVRIGLAIEPPLAHALVDRLLGFDRLPAEGRLQVTPVEWGILSFVLARALDRLDETPGPLGTWDLSIDRVGAEPADMTGLGPIVTWRWRVRIGKIASSARLWLPESLMALWLLDDLASPTEPIPLAPFTELTSDWRAEAGSIVLAKGIADLTPGALLLLEGSPLSGAPGNPAGSIELVQDDAFTRSYFEASPLPGSQAVRLILESPMKRKPKPRVATVITHSKLAASQSPHATATAIASPPVSSIPMPAAPLAFEAPADVPVTLIVELGRVSLPLHRLSQLKAGDIVELGRHAREPVELTSGGKLIARGELVQVDSELGVRVTQVFL